MQLLYFDWDFLTFKEVMDISYPFWGWGVLFCHCPENNLKTNLVTLTWSVRWKNGNESQQKEKFKWVGNTFINKEREHWLSIMAIRKFLTESKSTKKKGGGY